MLGSAAKSSSQLESPTLKPSIVSSIYVLRVLFGFYRLPLDFVFSLESSSSSRHIISPFFASASALTNSFRYYLTADEAAKVKSFSSAAFIAIRWIVGKPPLAVGKFNNDL
jgi:hypothetical protein